MFKDDQHHALSLFGSLLLLGSLCLLPVERARADLLDEAQQAIYQNDWQSTLEAVDDYLSSANPERLTEAELLKIKALWVSKTATGYEQMLTLCNQLLARADLTPAMRMETMLYLGRHQGLVQHDIPQAIETMQQALSLSEQVNVSSIRLIKRELHETLTHALISQSRLHEAEQHLNLALSLIQADDDPANVSYLFLTQAQVLRQQMRFAEAVKPLKHALSLLPPGQHLKREAQIHRRLGENYLSLKRYSDAIQHLRLAAEIYVEKEDKALLINALKNLGDAYFSSGDNDTAFVHYLNALELVQQVPNTSPEATFSLYRRIADVYYRQGDYNSSLAYLEKIRTPEHHTIQKWERVQSSISRAKTELALQHPQVAIEYAEYAATLANQADSPGLLIAAQENLASIYQQTGSTEKALNALKRVLAKKEELTSINVEHQLAKVASHESLHLERELAGKSAEIRTLEKTIATRELVVQGMAVLLLLLLWFLYFRLRRDWKQRRQVAESRRYMYSRHLTRLANARACDQFLQQQLGRTLSAKRAPIPATNTPTQFLAAIETRAIQDHYQHKGFNAGTAFEQQLGKVAQQLFAHWQLFQYSDSLFILSIESAESGPACAGEIKQRLHDLFEQLGVSYGYRIGVIPVPLLCKVPTAVEGTNLLEALLVTTSIAPENGWTYIEARMSMPATLLLKQVRDGLMVGIEKGFIRVMNSTDTNYTL